MAESKPTETTDTPIKAEAPVEEKKTDKYDKTDTETEVEDDWKARVEKIAQSAADKVRTEYAKKLKEREREIELLKTERMSENEKREYEANKLKEALEAKERDLTYRENELLAVKALEEKKIPAVFTDFVISDNKDKTLDRIAQLEKVFAEEVKKAVDIRMKDYGRNPAKGRVSDGTSGFQGMSMEQIKEKARVDRKWWAQNESAILEHFRKGDPARNQ